MEKVKLGSTLLAKLRRSLAFLIPCGYFQDLEHEGWGGLEPTLMVPLPLPYSFCVSVPLPFRLPPSHSLPLPLP